MITIELMQDFSEIVQYEQSRLPLYIRTADLSVYPDMSAPCHWHEDIEWIHIIKGQMRYYINGKHILLEEGDSLMINTRQMHYGYSYEKQDCRFACILFHPSLFCSNSALLQKYVTPILKTSTPEYLHFCHNQDTAQEVSKLLTQIVHLKENPAEGYELEAIALIQILWSRLWKKEKLRSDSNNQETPDDLKTQKDMVSYLYQHYSEKITLDEIAASGNVSRSKCCRIFQHYLQQSPIDFLNTYRLKVSASLLDTTDKTITEIAFACGFNHLSYFSKLFCAHYQCTPREYRKHRHPIPNSQPPQ